MQRYKEYDLKLEADVTKWVESVSGVPKPADQKFSDWLKSGEVLCKLANGIKAGSIAKFHEGTTMKFKQMENITQFLVVCRTKFRVMEKDLFSTVDLHEEKDMNAVLLGLWNVAGTIQTTVDGYSGMKFGIKQKCKLKGENDEQSPGHAQSTSPQNNESKLPLSKATYGVAHRGSPMPSVDNVLSFTSINRGVAPAPEGNRTPSGNRQSTEARSDSPDPMVDRRALPPSKQTWIPKDQEADVPSLVVKDQGQAQTPSQLRAPQLATEASPTSDQSNSLAASSAGMPAQNATSSGRHYLMRDNSDKELERVVVLWVSDVLGLAPCARGEYGQWLRSGEVLCFLGNTLLGMTDRKDLLIKKIASPTDPALLQHENITRFVNLCRHFGVQEKDLFRSIDLFDGKDTRAVLNCLYALGGVLQNYDWFPGPQLGKRQPAANAKSSAASYAAHSPAKIAERAHDKMQGINVD